MCLLLSLGNLEVQQQVFRSIGEKKFSIVSQDSEELNKILVLTLARAVNTVCDSGQTGTWCVSLLRKVFEHTPHSWSPHPSNLPSSHTRVLSPEPRARGG
ncbi:MED23 [Bugula neritina]|uniref:MED23 n=1 Tax=Bugula neritina TaxID=10212 RepID=A0A7J7KE71_BUGNE|nr:MED23 [Bugula neritina]